jgi:hypothetical protein
VGGEMANTAKSGDWVTELYLMYLVMLWLLRLWLLLLLLLVVLLEAAAAGIPTPFLLPYLESPIIVCCHAASTVIFSLKLQSSPARVHFHLSTAAPIK